MVRLGFLAEQVDAPLGDEVDGRWVGAAWIVTSARSSTCCGATERHAPGARRPSSREVAAVGGRFDQDPPTLAWICFHVLQEYARHVGHLDIATELAGGPTGE